MNFEHESDLKISALRLLPGQDLKQSIRQFAEDHEVEAGAVLTAVGSLSTAVLRMANQEQATTCQQKFEIVSLVGTFSRHGVHLHMSVSNSQGKMLGGHVADGCVVFTTVELILGRFPALVFQREPCELSGYKELVVSSTPNNA